MIDVSKYEAAKEASAAREAAKEASAALTAAKKALDVAHERAHAAGCGYEEAQDRLRSAETVCAAQQAAEDLSPAMREMLTSDTVIGTLGTAKALYRRGLLCEIDPDAYPTHLGYDVMHLLRGQRLSGVPDDMQPNKGAKP